MKLFLLAVLLVPLAIRTAASADGSMSEVQQREYLKKFESDLISPAEEALWKRGASNAGYHYLGRAKTFALMGRALRRRC